MKFAAEQSKYENIIYAVLWGMLFTAPIISSYVRAATDSSLVFQWDEVLMAWRVFAVYLLLFLVHNFLLAPLLVFRHRLWLYVTLTVSLLAVFALYKCSTRPDDRHRPQDIRLRSERPLHHGFDERADQWHRPPADFRGGVEPPADFRGGEKPPVERAGGENGPHDRPPLMFGEHDIVAVVMLLLLFGANLGLKLYFRTRREAEKLVQLEKESLEQQLEYLKYQLNPHFLMNTLNNIHALIDIDSAQAQEAVIRLSKILRYVLYDSNKPLVPLSQETEFMTNYIELMRMRYTASLTITTDEPETAGVTVAPLLFISFVENAFKHGVSYQQKSFIYISGKRYQPADGSERLLWTCRNSKHDRSAAAEVPRQGGVGMANVRRRLELIYGNDYTLNVSDADGTYSVALDIPLSANK